MSGAASDALKTLLREGRPSLHSSLTCSIELGTNRCIFRRCTCDRSCCACRENILSGIADVFRILWGRLPRSQLKALQDLMMSESTGCAVAITLDLCIQQTTAVCSPSYSSLHPDYASLLALALGRSFGSLLIPRSLPSSVQVHCIHYRRGAVGQAH